MPLIMYMLSKQLQEMCGPLTVLLLLLRLAAYSLRLEDISLYMLTSMVPQHVIFATA